MKTLKTVSQTLAEKSSNAVYSINPQTSVFEALRIMSEKNVGALIVLDGGRLVGIVSERDYTRKVDLCGRFSAATPVSAIMTRKVVTVGPKESNQRCMQLMTAGHLRHLPVIEDEQIVGLVSIGDLVKGIIAEQQDLIDHLQKYIRGE
ncbi:CBS domain-containing protein [Pseudomonas sp. RIT-PI-q]|uniref:CBS domain-containing protein n=1 Tax=Pseudomonas sp. RIT-PI-q TaxID=1690247 RepID=UPI0009E83A88|nr:CBS domain-containing protein [Pseudomonas sp. RIT-PI-q]